MQIHAKLNGEQTVKLTKTEIQALRKAQAICNMIERTNSDDGTAGKIGADISLLCAQLQNSPESPTVQKPY